MNVRLEPSVLTGTVPAIPSKSDVHRLLFCAAQADAPVTLQLDTDALSEDIQTTLGVIETLGAGVVVAPGSITVTPAAAVSEEPLFDCKESGSTLRFLLPVAARLCRRPSFTGSGRLPERPIGDLLDALASNGVSASSDRLPLQLSGTLRSGVYELPGNVSSQYITGLLLALPALEGDSEIRLTTELQSSPYIDITIHALRRFGVRIDLLHNGWHVPGGQTFRSPGTLSADGDWSGATFFLCAGALGKEPVTVSGLSPDSPQGDKNVLRVLRGFGAKYAPRPDENRTMAITVQPSPLSGTAVDVTDIPDAFPMLAVLAAFAEGRTTFTGGARLRLKESDRIASVKAMLEALGGKAEETPDGLIVCGTEETGGLKGGTVDACNDHRIVMAAAIAAMNASGPVTILGAEAVRKSYPNFMEELTRLGGTVHGI